MTDDFYMIAITALMPLMAVLLVLQVNPYQALVIRGILGAIAALVYALFGAADVALTEALVGTMLSITLYAVAVRSSMVVQIGVLEQAPLTASLRGQLEQVLNKHHVRIELLTYPDASALATALANKEIHVSYESLVCLKTRIRRLHEIFELGLPPDINLVYTGATLPSPPDTKQSKLVGET